MIRIGRVFGTIALLHLLYTAPPIFATDKCDNRPYTSNDERLDRALHYFCMNRQGDEPVELKGRKADYTIHVETVMFGGGEDEYRVIITRKDRKKKEVFIEGNMNAELDGEAMFSFMAELYAVERKGRHPEEFGFDKPEQNDEEKDWKYKKRVKKFEADTRWANRRYDSTLSELERLLKKKMADRKN